MRTTLNNLNNIVFYAVDDTVCLVNSTAPIRRKVAARSCQKLSKQICLWDLAQSIDIISIIQIVTAI